MDRYGKKRIYRNKDSNPRGLRAGGQADTSLATSAIPSGVMMSHYRRAQEGQAQLNPIPLIGSHCTSAPPPHAHAPSLASAHFRLDSRPTAHPPLLYTVGAPALGAHVPLPFFFFLFFFLLFFLQSSASRFRSSAPTPARRRCCCCWHGCSEPGPPARSTAPRLLGWPTTARSAPGPEPACSPTHAPRAPISFKSAHPLLTF